MTKADSNAYDIVYTCQPDEELVSMVPYRDMVIIATTRRVLAIYPEDSTVDTTLSVAVLNDNNL